MENCSLVSVFQDMKKTKSSLVFEQKTFPFALSLAFTPSLPPAWGNWPDKNSLLG